MSLRPKHLPPVLREVPKPSPGLVQRRPAVLPPRSPAPHVRAAVAKIAQPAFPVARPGSPGHAIQRAAAAPAAAPTPSSVVSSLEQMGALPYDNETKESARERLDGFLTGQSVEFEVKLPRSMFDQDGRATLTAMAAQTDATRTVEGTVFEVIDLKNRFVDTKLRPLFMYMYTAVRSVEINYKNGPLHRNEEHKLPLSDNEWRYIECYYAGGGTRLVVDVKTWISYVSAHYGKFYVLADAGQNPVTEVQRLVVEARVVSGAYRTGNWNGFKALYPAKVKALTGGS